MEDNKITVDEAIENFEEDLAKDIDEHRELSEEDLQDTTIETEEE